jgi:hypothetical protein
VEAFDMCPKGLHLVLFATLAFYVTATTGFAGDCRRSDPEPRKVETPKAFSVLDQLASKEAAAEVAQAARAVQPAELEEAPARAEPALT